MSIRDCGCSCHTEPGIMHFMPCCENTYKQMKKIDAEIVADSTNQFGDRITTFVVTLPRIVLAEFNTHRMFSRNSASSRAIPFKKMVKMVKEDPFIPIKWQKDHSGMQGEELVSEQNARYAEKHWLEARDAAVKYAEYLNLDTEVTKQFCNRLLEPFMWHTIIVTATEWENFFKLRAHPAAEIHIADLAYKMQKLYKESTPKELKEGEWHIPFGDSFDDEKLERAWHKNTHGKALEDVKVMIATARCARVSYLNYEGKDDYDADIKLFDRLSGMGHWSPFEHCAKAMSEDEIEQWTQTVPKTGVTGEFMKFFINKDRGMCGNFKGFVQLRKTFEDESGR